MGYRSNALIANATERDRGGDERHRSTTSPWRSRHHGGQNRDRIRKPVMADQGFEWSIESKTGWQAHAGGEPDARCRDHDRWENVHRRELTIHCPTRLLLSSPRVD